jgi:SAM-dependent methyltransferase
LGLDYSRLVSNAHLLIQSWAGFGEGRAKRKLRIKQILWIPAFAGMTKRSGWSQLRMETSRLPVIQPTVIEERIWHHLTPRRTGGLVRNKALVFRDCVDWEDWYREPDKMSPEDWECKMVAGCRGEWFARAVEGAGRILDVGCGFGFPSFYLARCGYNVVGIDPSPSEIETANQIAKRVGYSSNVRFEVVSQEKLPFDDDSFDAATFSTSLECVGEPERLLSEVRRVLRPGSPVAVGEEDRSLEPKSHPVWEKLRWAFFDDAIWLWYEIRIWEPYLDRRYMLQLDMSGKTAARVRSGVSSVLSGKTGLPVLDFKESKVSLDDALSEIIGGEWSEARGYDGPSLKELLEESGFSDILFWPMADGAEFARSLHKSGLLEEMPDDIRKILRAIVQAMPATKMPVGCMVTCRT